MTKAEVIKQIESGKIALIGTFFSGKAETITVRNKTTPGGASREMAVTRCVVMTEDEPVSISAFLPDGHKAADWKQPARKGDKVVVFITSMETKLGAKTVRGDIEILS